MRPRTFSDQDIFGSMSTLLARDGYDSLTLQNIAEHAKVSPAILSKRFGSKLKLMSAYYDYLIELTEESFAALDQLDLQPMEKIKTVFLHWYEHFKKPIEFANLSALYLKLDTEPEFIEKSKERLRIIDEAVKKLLREGMDAGEIRQTNIDELSFLLQAAATGAFMMWCKSDGDPTPDVLLDRCFRYILNEAGA